MKGVDFNLFWDLGIALYFARHNLRTTSSIGQKSENCPMKSEEEVPCVPPILAGMVETQLSQSVDAPEAEERDSKRRKCDTCKCPICCEC